MQVENSLSDFLKQLIIQHRNTLSMWDGLSSALTTDQQNIVVNNNDFNGNTFQISIPSLKGMQKEIDTLKQNFESFSGSNGSSVVRTPDGDFKKIVISSLLKEPDDLSTISTPVNFGIKTNWFFENFLNPLLYVSFDYTGIIPLNVKRAEVTKFILSLDTESKLNFFEQNYKLRSDINYNDFVLDMQKNGITYIIDSSELPIATKENVYYGNFSVNRIYDETETIEINGSQQTVTRKKYELNTLKYNSKLTNIKYTQSLKVGDELVVNLNNKNSKYVISEIDAAKNTVVLDHLEGYDVIIIGNDILSYYGVTFSKVNVQVPIGFDNYLVLFIRPIDENSNLVSNFYSPGTAFYTNQLKINIDGNAEQTLESYYTEQVTDFGQFLLGFSKDNSTPAIFGSTPSAPTLDPTSFKVVEVNTHLTQQKVITDLQKLQLEKNSLSSELNELDTSISSLQGKISTKNYSNTNEKKSDQTQLDLLSSEKENKKSTYNSLVLKIAGYSTNTILGTKPKYRLRGFWPIPTPITNSRSQTQNVIQFIISYRYQSSSGSTNPVTQIDFTDTNGVKRKASFSDWTELKTKVRTKSLNTSTGSYEWDDEKVENGDVVNINQLDIPIQQGETVQFKIKSVSEAGFPSNPLTSEWSDVISYTFPDTIAIDAIASDIVDQANQEAVKVQLDNELKSLGILTHISSMHTVDGISFDHDSKDIDSGFLSTTNKPINLYDKIKQQDDYINQLQTAITGSIEKYSVYLVDESNNQIDIKLGVKNQIFAGYYRDIVQHEVIKMGAIVTKVYKLVIKNESSVPLVIDSLDKGPSSNISNIGIVSGVTYKFGLVPVGMQNYKLHITQKQGQFIYNRYTNINTNNLYSHSTNIGLYNYGSSITDCVILNSAFSSTVSLSSGFLYLHQDHPDVVGNTYPSTKSNLFLPDSIDLINQQSEFDSNTKISFDQNDRYLIGPNSTGAFAYILCADNSNSNIRIVGDTIYSNRIIDAGKTIEIPIIFQFRMTDYWGDTSGSNYGIGRIGGQTNLSNLTYTKTLGFDMITKFGGQQGFDIEFNAKYAPDGVSLPSGNNSGGSSITSFVI